MLAVLQFIFSDFFIWAGTVILVVVSGACVAGVIEALRK